MLGPAKPRRLDAPIAVSLEDLVPADTVTLSASQSTASWSLHRGDRTPIPHN